MYSTAIHPTSKSVFFYQIIFCFLFMNDIIIYTVQYKRYTYYVCSLSPLSFSSSLHMFIRLFRLSRARHSECGGGAPLISVFSLTRHTHQHTWGA